MFLKTCFFALVVAASCANIYDNCSVGKAYVDIKISELENNPAKKNEILRTKLKFKGDPHFKLTLDSSKDIVFGEEIIQICFFLHAAILSFLSFLGSYKDNPDLSFFGSYEDFSHDLNPFEVIHDAFGYLIISIYEVDLIMDSRLKM